MYLFLQLRVENGTTAFNIMQKMVIFVKVVLPISEYTHFDL